MRENRFVIVVMASAFGLLLLWTAWTEWRFHQHAEGFIWQQHAAMASDSISSMASILQSAKISLISAVSALEQHHQPIADQYQRTLSQFRQYVSVTPSVTSLVAFGRNGNLLVHSRYDTAPTSVNAVDRQYFRFFADGVAKEEHALFVGDPIKGKLSGEWSLALSRSFTDSEGQFAGVVLATLSIDILTSHMRRLSERTAASQVALMTETSTVVGAFIPGDQRVWTSQSFDALPFAFLLPSEISLADATLHDEEHGTIIQHFQNIPLFLAISWTWDQALSDLHGGYGHDFLLFAGVGVVLIGVWVVLSRAIRDRNRLFDLSPYPVCVLDSRGAFISANPAWKKILDLDESELQGRLLSEFVIPDDQLIFQKVFLSLLEGNRTGESVFKVKGAQEKLASLSFEAVNEDKHIFAVARDISHRLETESALRESEQRFRDVVEASGEFVWEVDSKRRITFVTERVVSTLGYQPADLIGRDVADFIRGSDRTDVIANMTAATDFFQELEAVCADGSIIVLRLSGVPIRTQDRHPAGFRGTALDITDRHRARQALLDSEERFRSIINTVVDGIITFDRQGVILSVNPAAEHMFSCTSQEIIGKKISDLMTDAQAGPYSDYIMSRLESSEEGQARELQGQRSAGEVFPIELSVGKLTSHGHVFFAGIIRDISERKRMERMKSEFISTVSHELRTPLTSIRGSLSLVHAGVAGKLSEKAYNLISIAYSNCDKLIRLVNDILDIQKMEAGRMEFDMEEVDLVKVAHQSMIDNAAFASQYSVRIVSGPMPGQVVVYGDQNRLGQVVTNFLSNAVKFSPTGGVVTVSIYITGTAVRLIVQDKGPGIPESFQDRIFQKFSQADSTDRRAKGGTGLGLSISKMIVEQHGGNIGFDTQEQQGTAFYIDLPALLSSGADSTSPLSDKGITL